MNSATKSFDISFFRFSRYQISTYSEALTSRKKIRIKQL